MAIDEVPPYDFTLVSRFRLSADDFGNMSPASVMISLDHEDDRLRVGLTIEGEEVAFCSTPWELVEALRAQKSL